MHVRRSVAQKIKGQSIIETPPKNKSSYRDLQIPKPLLKILAEHKKRQMRDDHFSDDFRVCGGIKCLSDTAIENKNKLFAKAAGLPHIRIHDFRHPYVKPTTKKFLSFFKFEMAISLRAFLCFALLLGIKEGPQLVPFIR